MGQDGGRRSDRLRRHREFADLRRALGGPQPEAHMTAASGNGVVITIGAADEAERALSVRRDSDRAGAKSARNASLASRP